MPPRLKALGEVEYDTDDKFEGSVGLSWRMQQRVALGFRWHSEFGFGGGLDLRF